MNPDQTSNEEFMELIEEDDKFSMVDDFIKELEAKEKDLHISSDLVIEVDDSDIEHENIHNSFISQEIPKKDERLNFNLEKFAQNANYSELEERVSQLTDERTELKESLMRGKRDYENYRNRVERERQETFKNILSNLANQMLPVLDNLNRALDSATESEKNPEEKDFQTFLEGIVLVNQQLNEVLMGMGVQPIIAVGEQFNPNFHEAVDKIETDEFPHSTIIEELLRGYKIDSCLYGKSCFFTSTKNFS